ncbi:hypothetical protein EDB86DRAFT_1841598 [Lactarius hatsudake]|nr:hypothetical protein EDB86DRAFT_1841598 [Lactarius hatsudake]
MADTARLELSSLTLAKVFAASLMITSTLVLGSELKGLPSVGSAPLSPPNSRRGSGPSLLWQCSGPHRNWRPFLKKLRNLQSPPLAGPQLRRHSG